MLGAGLHQRLRPDLGQELAQEIVHRHRGQRGMELLHETLLQQQVDFLLIEQA